MATPYVGEIRLFGGNFAPVGWHFCDGSLMAISENDVLFSLIGTTYGGDGQVTFGLPDLRGRVPIHTGQGPGLSDRPIGQLFGTEQVTLTTQQIPSHSHPIPANTAVGSLSTPAGAVTAQSSQLQIYIEDDTDQAMAASTVSNAGGSQPHDNMMPFLCINYIIALQGIYPSRN